MNKRVRLRLLAMAVGVATGLLTAVTPAAAETPVFAWWRELVVPVPRDTIEDRSKAVTVAAGPDQSVFVVCNYYGGQARLSHVNRFDGHGRQRSVAMLGYVDTLQPSLIFQHIALAAAFDGFGNGFLTGVTTQEQRGPGQGYDAFVAKVGAYGNIEWTHQVGTAGDDRAATIGLDGNGDVVVAGTFLTKFSTLGQPVWGVLPVLGGDPARAARFLAFDAGNNPIIAGGSSGAVWVAKHAAGNGKTLWQRTFNTFGTLASLAVDAAGNVVLGGSRIIKLNGATGATRWTRTAAPVGAARLDKAGNILVNGGAVVAKLAPTGQVLSSISIDISGDYAAQAWVFGPDGSLYVAGGRDIGNGNSSIWVARFDSQGVRRWLIGEDRIGYQAVTHMALDSFNDPLIVGRVEYGDRTGDDWVAKVERLP